MEFEVIKKAWKVWHDGMLNSNPNKGYSMEDLPVIYADTASEAKSKLDLYEYDLKDGREATYLDIKVKRSKEDDKVLFDGRSTTISNAKEIIERREKLRIKIEKVNKYPDDAMFYVQNGWVGNAMLFWGLGSAGYYTDITKCQKYTKQEILKSFIDIRDSEVIWSAEHIEKALIQIAHSEKVDRQFAIKI